VQHLRSPRAAREVGGDFYRFFFTGDDHLCFAIGDVSGKGVPASLFMALAKTLLKAAASKGRGPDEMLARLNHEICRDNEVCMFVTILCGILDMRTGGYNTATADIISPMWLARRGANLCCGPRERRLAW
jgi:phosphoserine phosphatase RsbU/P